MINFSARLTQSNREIQQLILENIKDYLSPRIQKATRNIQYDITVGVAQGMRSEPEYNALTQGSLRAEFGISSPAMVDVVIDSLSRAVEMEVIPLSVNRSGIIGGFTLNMIKSDDLSGVINSFAANITTSKGETLPWLQWLTLSGNKILIRDYKINFGTYPTSRSGMAVMKPSEGGFWRVPTQFVGTINNNWITRAISRIENSIYNIMIRAIQAEI